MDEEDRGGTGAKHAKAYTEAERIMQYVYTQAQYDTAKDKLSNLAGALAVLDPEELQKLLKEMEQEKLAFLIRVDADEVSKQEAQYRDHLRMQELVKHQEEIGKQKADILIIQKRFDTNIKEFVGALKKETGVLEDLTKDIKDGKEIDLTALDQLKLSDEELKQRLDNITQIYDDYCEIKQRYNKIHTDVERFGGEIKRNGDRLNNPKLTAEEKEELECNVSLLKGKLQQSQDLEKFLGERKVASDKELATALEDVKAKGVKIEGLGKEVLEKYGQTPEKYEDIKQKYTLLREQHKKVEVTVAQGQVKVNMLDRSSTQQEQNTANAPDHTPGVVGHNPGKGTGIV